MFQEMHWLPYTIIPKTSLYTTRYGILKKGHWGDLHTHIYCQVQNNAPVRDLSNLCVLVLLQKTIPWPLAFESVVWDVTRITENQTIDLMINLENNFWYFFAVDGIYVLITGMDHGLTSNWMFLPSINTNKNHLRSAMHGSPLGQFFLVASKEEQGRQGKESERTGSHW